MVTNTSLTVYHKVIDKTTKLEKWERKYYDKIWWYGGRGSTQQQGYANSDSVQIRIPYAKNEVNVNDFEIGDILVKGKCDIDIVTQQDLKQEEVYNITSIKDNRFGKQQHMHISGV